MAPTRRHRVVDPPSPRVPAPLVDAEAALDAVLLMASDPPRAETLALFLDDSHTGRTACVVSGTTRPDDVLDVAALVAESAGGSPAVHAVVLASVRDTPTTPAVQDEDIKRWLVLLDLFDEVGVELLDWFVLSPDPWIRSLREHTGMPPLWRSA